MTGGSAGGRGDRRRSPSWTKARGVLATDVLGEELAQMRDAHPHVDRLAVHTADLADADQVRSIVPAAANLLGGVDVLVNNAGVQPDGPPLDVCTADISTDFAVNVRAPMLLMQDGVPPWIERGPPGSIVNIASANAFQNESPESVYNASKAALVALTNAYAHEFGHHRIRANVVAPGETITPEAEQDMSQDPANASSCSATCEDPPPIRRHPARPGDGGAVPGQRRRRFISAQTLDRRRRRARRRQLVRRRGRSTAAARGQAGDGMSETDVTTPDVPVVRTELPGPEEPSAVRPSRPRPHRHARSPTRCRSSRRARSTG